MKTIINVCLSVLIVGLTVVEGHWIKDKQSMHGILGRLHRIDPLLPLIFMASNELNLK